MSHDSTTAIDQLDHATDQIREVAGTLLWARDHAEVDDLYRAGGALTQLTGALREIAQHLAVAAAHAGDHRILYDDHEGDPQARIADAIRHLRTAETSYTAASEAIASYHSTIGHIGVQADLNAPGEDQ